MSALQSQCSDYFTFSNEQERRDPPGARFRRVHPSGKIARIAKMQLCRRPGRHREYDDGLPWTTLHATRAPDADVGQGRGVRAQDPRDAVVTPTDGCSFHSLPSTASPSSISRARQALG